MSLMTATALDFRALWADAIPYADFVSAAEKNCGLWEGVYRSARIPQWAIDEACVRATRIRLLVIAEDWCGDASNTVPILAKLGDLVSCLDLRIIGRDTHPDVMDRYLTNGTRSIPIVIALDAAFQPLGHWGPRPSELQSLVHDHTDTMSKVERYRRTRRWYAKDRGESTLREVLALLD